MCLKVSERCASSVRNWLVLHFFLILLALLQLLNYAEKNHFVDGGFRWDRSYVWKLTDIETSAIKKKYSNAAG